MQASATEARRNTVGYNASAPAAGAASEPPADAKGVASPRNRGIGARWPPESPTAGAPTGRPLSPGRLPGADVGAPQPPADEQYDEAEGESDEFSMPGDSPPRDAPADT